MVLFFCCYNNKDSKYLEGEKFPDIHGSADDVKLQHHRQEGLTRLPPTLTCLTYYSDSLSLYLCLCLPHHSHITSHHQYQHVSRTHYFEPVLKKTVIHEAVRYQVVAPLTTASLHTAAATTTTRHSLVQKTTTSRNKVKHVLLDFTYTY